MLFIGLLLLAPTVQALQSTLCFFCPQILPIVKYASVEGSVTCDGVKGTVQLLQDVFIQLREYDAIGEDDNVGSTYTTSGGNFSVTGFESETYGHNFYVEVKVPCWGEAIKQCANRASMCTHSGCEYYVKISVPEEYYYDGGKPKKIFRLTDINVETAKADDRYSMCL